MYIMNGAKNQIINAEFVERFCISEKDDAALIVLSYSSERPAVTLARYKDAKEARTVLADLLLALAGGQSYYSMPDSLVYGEERHKMDARTKRKGGS